METQQPKKLLKMIQQKNLQVKKHFNKSDISSIYKLTLDTAFGINSNPICNQLQVVGQKYVIFMVGNIVVAKDLSDKSEKFFFYPNHFNNVTALYGISKQQRFKEKIKKFDKDGKPMYIPNSAPIKIYLAQSSENQQKMASIVSLKPYKNKMRTMCTGIKGVIKEMTVDRSKKMIACLLQSVQNTHAVIFNYRKQKLLTSTCLKMASIFNLSFHPQKQKSIVLMGKNYLRLWQLHPQQNMLKQNQQLVPLKIQKQSIFYDLSWQTNSKNPILFVLTNKNKMLLIQNDTLVHTIYLSEKQQLYSVVATKKGFCVGGAHKCLSIYELDKVFNNILVLGSVGKTNDRDSNEDKIIRIHNSTNDGYCTIVTTNQIGSFNFFYINTSRIDADISSLDQFFTSGFHHKKINSLSCSVTKQILASCSEDHTVKLWNFFQTEGYEKKGLISQPFSQQPISIAMHPCGLFVAVSFASGFKVFAIIHDRLEVLKDIQIPNCKLIKYSHGGHFLVVNEKQHIFIYDSIFYQTLNLFSLSNNVQDITISHDDTKIVTTCVNGYVYCFNLYDSVHNKDYHNKKGYEHKQSKQYNCIAYDNKIMVMDKNEKQVQLDLFVGCTTDKYMVVYKNKCKQLIAEFPIVDCHITALLICALKGVLLAGTSKGTLRVYAWPMVEHSFELQLSPLNQVKFKHPQFIQVIAHCYPLVTICSSYDQGYVFTGSQDGTILCFHLLSYHHQLTSPYSLIKPQDKHRIAQSANDLYLQRVDTIQTKNQAIKKLKFEILRSEKKLKLQKEKLDIIYRQKMDTLKKQYKITLQTNKKIKNSYIQNSTKQYQQLTDKLDSDKKIYKEESEKLKKDHQQKIDFELKRNQQIKKEIEALHKKHSDQIVTLKDDHQKSMKQTKFDFYDKCHKLQIRYSNFLNQSKRNSQQFANQLNKKEKQYEHEIEMQIRSKKQEIIKVKSINKELQVKNEKLNDEYNRLKRQDQEQQQIFEKLFKQHNDIRFENLKSDEQILKMQHQLLQRLQVIQNKEETCKNSRYQQTTLQNFRYMLDSKIQSLQEKKTEMIQKIRNRQLDLKNMFNELIKESEQNEKKSLQLKQLNVKIQGLQKQIKLAEEQIDSNQNKLHYFKGQITSIANSNEDLKTTGKRLKKLVDECQKKNSEFSQIHKQTGDNQDSTKQVNDQLERQAKWMEKKLKMVKDIAVNYKQMREENINGVLGQNTKLIEECNKLRKLNEQYKKNIKIYEKQLSDLLRKKEKSVQIKKIDDTLNFKGINKKLEQHEVKISNQKNQLALMNKQIKQIIKSKSDAKFLAVRKMK